MSTAPPLAAERLATLLRCLCLAVAGQAAGGRLSLALIAALSRHLIDINLRIRRIVARIQVGHVTSRRVAARRRPATRRPRRPGALPTRCGWLLPLLPDAASFRSQLEYLFRDPEMAALLEAAPEALRRPIRSLCWMLWLKPPPILAPRRPAKPAPDAGAGPGSAAGDPLPPSAAPRQPAAPEAPPPLRPPSPARATPAGKRRAPPRACGPPLPV